MITDGPQTNSDDEGHCVWYGTDADTRFNLAYNGAANPLNDPDRTEKLKSICPDLFSDMEGLLIEANCREM